MDGYRPETYGDAIADVYDEWYPMDAEGESAVAFLFEASRGGRVLELGVGTGKLAIPLAERGLALSRDRHLPQLSPEVADQLGHVYALSGHVAEGLPLLEEALTSMEAMAMVQWRSPLLVHLGETYLLASRPGDALASPERL